MAESLLYAAFIGYLLAALAYLGLAGIVVAGWRSRPHGRLLALVALLTALWSAAVAGALLVPLRTEILLSLEIVQAAAWVALLYFILKLRLPPGARLPLPLRVIALTLTPVTLAVLALLLLSSAPLPTSGLIWLLMLALSVAGLVLVEQLWRGTGKEKRWAIKYLCIGLAGAFTYAFFLYANAALFSQLDTQIWAARGYVAALITPLIAVSAARNPDWSAPISVSRSVVFHTASLIAAGAYLLVIAGAGYYIQLFGGDWGDVVRTVFFFAGALLLVMLLVSGTLRARVRVFLSKHFFSYRFDYREAWLKFTRTLAEGQSGNTLCTRTLEAMAGLLESPGGVLWLRESGHFVRAAHWNWGALDTRLAEDAAMVVWLAERQWVIDLDEYRRTPDKYGALEVPDWLANNEDAWLVIPLILQNRLTGIVVLKHPLAKIPFDWEINDLVKVAACQAAVHLAQMQAAQELIVARQFESFNRTTTFVIHDLKNLVAQLSLLLANAEKHRHNPDFQTDMIETVGHAVTRMNKVLSQLRRASPEAPSRLDLATLIKEAVASKRAFKLKPTLALPATPVLVMGERERLSRAMGHLVQNALEATPETGKVCIRLEAAEGMARIDIEDTGSGMDADFIQSRLFAPFDSTKGAGMGIGAYEARETVRALGGEIRVRSEPGRGTCFTVTIPLAPTEDSSHV